MRFASITYIVISCFYRIVLYFYATCFVDMHPFVLLKVTH